MPINRLVVDLEQSVAPESTGDLLWTPLVPDELLQKHPVRVRKLLISTREGATCTRSRDCFAGAIGLVVAGIASDLPPNRSSVAADMIGHFRNRKALFSEGRDDYPLSRGDLEIFHRDLPNLAGKGSIALSQITSLLALSVALGI